MSTICYITSSPIITDRRSLNQMKLLEEMGHHGILIGLWQKDIAEEEIIFSTKIIRFKINNPVDSISGFLKFNYKIYKFLKNISFDLLHVHELWPIPGSVLYAKKRRKPVIYDTHDFFSLIEIFKQNKKKKRFWYLIEKLFTPFTNALITVSEPHRRIYNLAYNHFIHKDSMVIYNVPEKTEYGTFEIPSDRQLPDKFIIFVRQDNNLVVSSSLIKSMKYIEDGTILIICDYGNNGSELIAFIKEQALENKVIIYKMLKNNELFAIAAKAIAGIILFEPLSINNRYAMPDIFFEYIQAETPVIVSNLATFRTIFDNYEVGILVNRLTPESIGSAIKQILVPTDRELYLKNLKIAKEVFHWDMEKQKLARLYEKLLRTDNPELLKTQS